MKRASPTLLFLCLALSFDAHAGVKLHLESCEKVVKGDRAACKKEATEKCAAAKTYSEGEKCVAEVVGRHDACRGEGFARACDALRKVADGCRKTEAPTEAGEYAELYKANVAAFPNTQAAVAEFKKEWGACEGVSGGCRPPVALHDCGRAEAKYKQSWQARVTKVKSSATAAHQNIVQPRIEQEEFESALAENKRILRDLEFTKALDADLGWLSVKDPELDPLIAEATKVRADIEAKAKAKLAKQRCPKARLTDAKLLAAVKPAVEAHYQGSDERSGNTKTALKVLRLDGKKTQERNQAEGVLYEYAPVTACVERVGPEATYCQVFSLSVRREKPDGGKWSDWNDVLVGDAAEMLCENLLK